MPHTIVLHRSGALALATVIALGAGLAGPALHPAQAKDGMAASSRVIYLEDQKKIHDRDVTVIVIDKKPGPTVPKPPLGPQPESSVVRYPGDVDIHLPDKRIIRVAPGQGPKIIVIDRDSTSCGKGVCVIRP